MRHYTFTFTEIETYIIIAALKACRDSKDVNVLEKHAAHHLY